MIGGTIFKIITKDYKTDLKLNAWILKSRVRVLNNEFIQKAKYGLILRKINIKPNEYLLIVENNYWWLNYLGISLFIYLQFNIIFLLSKIRHKVKFGFASKFDLINKLDEVLNE